MIYVHPNLLHWHTVLLHHLHSPIFSLIRNAFHFNCFWWLPILNCNKKKWMSIFDCYTILKMLVNTWAWSHAEAVERDLLVAYPVIDICVIFSVILQALSPKCLCQQYKALCGTWQNSLQQGSTGPIHWYHSWDEVRSKVGQLLVCIWTHLPIYAWFSVNLTFLVKAHFTKTF